jgi:hypothetical protein
MYDVLKISLIAFMFSALTQDEHTLLSWYGKLLNKLPWYLCKPLGGCYRCFVGQVCLWYLVIKGETILEIMFLTSFGIMISMIYNKVYCYLK